MLTLFHRTTVESAAAILSEGFRDGRGHYGTEIDLLGVFLSDAPLDESEGAHGEVLLAVMLLIDVHDLADFELVEEGKGYREWCIPSAFINGRATVQRVDDAATWNVTNTRRHALEEAAALVEQCTDIISPATARKLASRIREQATQRSREHDHA